VIEAAKPLRVGKNAIYDAVKRDARQRGEALRWREDVDMIAKMIAVNQRTTTPKGRTRRTVPRTSNKTSGAETAVKRSA
jgi:hypothetical protein